MKSSTETFRRALARWFEREGRDYPWRRTRDPYAILVSEIMLQQTQIATVLGPRRYSENWLETFPDAAALAAAPEDRVLKAWEGLGYYSRARNLQRAARMIVEECGGAFPRSRKAIEALPGVGRYTAGAVASFAFDLPEAIVDANVARVLARLFDYRELVDAEPGRSRLWVWAEDLVPERGARTHNSALMELGQRLCTAGEPACDECPVAASCRARGKDPGSLPVKKARVKTELVDEHALWAERDGKVLLHKQREGRRRKGLWKLPEREAGEVAARSLLLKMKYSITRYRVTLRVYAAGDHDEAPGSGEEWVALSKLSSIPMASPYRRAVTRILHEIGSGLM